MQTYAHPEARAVKFKQAAWAYLHTALLYEGTVYVLWKHRLVTDAFGPPALWLVAGAAVALAVFFGLYRWQHPWFARAIWLIHSARLPTLIGGAFFSSATGRIIPPALYLTALVVVLVNLWMLARAGWDL